MNKIDPTKKYITRDGQEVKDLHIQEDGRLLSGFVDGNRRLWYLSGKNASSESLDLMPDPEGVKITLARARSLITDAMTLCDDIGVNIAALVHEVVDASKNVDMARKWKLRGSGDKVTILTVSAPNKQYPVIGYADFDGRAMCWTADGRNIWGDGPSSCDLVPDDDASV